MNFKRMTRKILQILKSEIYGSVNYEFDKYKKSFSQSGEDLIIKSAFWSLKIEKPTYLDIGAHHAHYLSNTALFYLEGCRGVLVEPDPELFKEMAILRVNDTCLNVGIGSGEEETADFYVITYRALNTFSKVEAENHSKYGINKIEKVLKISLMNVNKIIDNYFSSTPSLICIDTEGYDMAILKSFNFEKYRPQIFCIETITYEEDKTEKKITEIIDFMLAKNYMIYSDTYINTIFIDKSAWENR